MKKVISVSLLVLAGAVATQAHAGNIGYCNTVGAHEAVDTGLSVSEVSITSAETAIGGTVILPYGATPINATNCAGIFNGN